MSLLPGLAPAGKMIVRFDDTNPSKEKDEYEESILADISTLGVKYDVITHTSDYFGVIEDYARKLIKDGECRGPDWLRRSSVGLKG